MTNQVAFQDRVKHLAFAVWLMFALAGHAQELIHSTENSFVHPGMLHSTDNLERMKRNVKDGTEPWAGAWKALQQSRFLAKNYEPQALEVVGRGVGSTGQLNITQDATAAYYNAIAWSITGDDDYAKKAIEILNNWSSTCKEIDGKDAVLCAGIYGYKFANAAEILRHCGHLWPEQDARKFQTWLQSVVLPVIKDFATYANGNWDACCLPTMMSIGIFCDDRAMFDRAVRYYQAGAGNGSLTHYIIDESGQCQESGRDQGHTQLGLGLLAVACEIGEHQGLDMYGEDDNRLLKGLEYTAKYNLGQDVPFIPFIDRTGKYNATRISTMSRGRFSAIWELTYNHYQNRLGMNVPLLAQAAAYRRPEWFSYDQPGNGTLLFSLPPFQPTATGDKPANAVSSIPGPIVATGSAAQNRLAWIASIGATNYTVKRAATADGPFTTIANHVQANSYVDSNVDAGKQYYYVVSAANSSGASKDTLPTGVTAGLPSPWTERDVGQVSSPGASGFDGSVFTVEAAGQNIGSTEDHFHFVYDPLDGDRAITARFVPPVSSQFSKMGLMIRSGLDADAPYVSVLLSPETTRDVEQPGWYVRMTVRDAAGAKAVDVAAVKLEQPYALWGRLMMPYRLRLVRTGNQVTALVSADGQKWTSIGSRTIRWEGPLSIGLAACSGQKKNSTTVTFDHVSVAKDVSLTDDVHSTTADKK